MASEEVRKKRKKLNQPQTSYCEAEKELNNSFEVQKFIDDLIRKKLVDKQKDKQEKSDQVETRNEAKVLFNKEESDQVETRNEAKVLFNKEELKENRVEEERRRKNENLNEDKKVKLMETLEKREAEEKRKKKAKKEGLKKAKKGK